MVQAYNARLLDQYELMRLHAYMTSQFSKPVTFEKYKKESWPLITDKEKQISETLKEKYERLKNGNKRNGDQSRG